MGVGRSAGRGARLGRRGFLAGLLAAGGAPQVGWAALGMPAFVSGARLSDGATVISGVSAAGDILFDIPTPARCHAGAAHPRRAEIVVFARRPGTFAQVIACESGDVRQELSAPLGHHFYGHGAFSSDGTRLFTTENHIEGGGGRVGVWDVGAGYRRLGSFATGGIGPHEILRGPGDVLIVANGGIRTHPDLGREKLNLDTMAPSIAYLDPGGKLLEEVALMPDMHQLSLRHIAVTQGGTLAVGGQWQGDPWDPPPMVWTHRRGGPLAPVAGARSLGTYVGSVAWSDGETAIAATAPRAGVALMLDPEAGAVWRAAMDDICGVAPRPGGVLFTTGTGVVLPVGRGAGPRRELARQWDNHVTAIPCAG